ncbi:MAG: dihydrofolate reductase [Planctomycetaceae bacterium]|nr:dihydrofolate reductase [Planctomycetaceae bacterium]
MTNTCSLIVAMSRNRVIGRAGDLPWRLSADLRRFKELTMGHHIIMGRKTYESIGRPLTGRKMVVISRRPARVATYAEVAPSLAEALQICQEDDQSFVIGGAQIYREALPLVKRLYLTQVHAEIAGDVVFPEFTRTDWTEIGRSDHEADEKNEYAYSFVVLERGDRAAQAS